jgi:hypothetical protein
MIFVYSFHYDGSQYRQLKKRKTFQSPSLKYHENGAIRHVSSTWNLQRST